MSALPMDLVKGTRNVKTEKLETVRERDQRKQQREAIRKKVSFLLVLFNVLAKNV